MKNRWVKCIALLLMLCFCAAGVSGCGEEVPEEIPEEDIVCCDYRDKEALYNDYGLIFQNEPVFDIDGYTQVIDPEQDRYVPQGENLELTFMFGRGPIREYLLNQNGLAFVEVWFYKEGGYPVGQERVYRMPLTDFNNDALYLYDPEAGGELPVTFTLSIPIDKYEPADSGWISIRIFHPHDKGDDIVTEDTMRTDDFVGDTLFSGYRWNYISDDNGYLFTTNRDMWWMLYLD